MFLPAGSRFRAGLYELFNGLLWEDVNARALHDCTSMSLSMAPPDPPEFGSLEDLAPGWDSLARGEWPAPAREQLVQLETSQAMELWNALSDRQRNCMRALLEYRAVDAESRQSAEDIAEAAEGRGANVIGFKRPLSDLVLRGLVASKTGRRGGHWLTGRGREVLDTADADSVANSTSR